MLSGIDHVGIAVADLDGTLPLYRDLLGMSLVHRETLDGQGVEAALLEAGSSHVELLAALGPETPAGRFVQRHGPGLHHVAYRVDSIEDALARLAAGGRRLIDERPRVGIRGTKVAFVHPTAMGGVLTEIVQLS